jgi:hypothetical protein
MDAVALNAVATSPAARAATRPGRALDAAQQLWALGGLAAIMLLGCLAAGLLDPRTLAGENVWLKPGKFALSFVALFATLAPVVERLSAPVRHGRPMRAATTALSLAFWGEMVVIGGRAARGEASHFNVGTPLDQALYSLMGAGALTLVAAIAVIGWLATRDDQARLGPGLRYGVSIGFVLAAGLTLVTAGTLSSLGGHFVGTPSPTTGTLPLLGWSTEVGDLRPAHFLALHAMQVLPLLGWWMDRRGQAANTAKRAVRRAAAVYAVLTAAVFIQALMGLPLWRA